ncbi:hypothetical protein V6N13_020078 [Hibiscus sabdariffa]|uniref:Uncharacterized protein n=1 Tax=Hibiscus sabdariffa TaxID=183260 RepID=A0ABR2ESW1_9ROSI
MTHNDLSNFGNGKFLVDSALGDDSAANDLNEELFDNGFVEQKQWGSLSSIAAVADGVEGNMPWSSVPGPGASAASGKQVLADFDEWLAE